MLGLIGAPESGIEVGLLETLLERSGGAIGILRDWLVDAEYAMRSTPGLDLETAIADAGPDDITVRQAAAEITDGLVRLGLAPESGVVLEQEPAADNRGRTAGGQRLKVGELGPARRDIGIPDVA